MPSVRRNRGQYCFTDLTGQRFGRLVVTHLAERRGSKNIWLCQCDCGHTSKVDISNLNTGSTQSCGCLKLEKLQAQRGSRHPNWKGGRVTSHQYVSNTSRYGRICSRTQISDGKEYRTLSAT